MAEDEGRRAFLRLAAAAGGAGLLSACSAGGAPSTAGTKAAGTAGSSAATAGGTPGAVRPDGHPVTVPGRLGCPRP